MRNKFKEAFGAFLALTVTVFILTMVCCSKPCQCKRVVCDNDQCVIVDGCGPGCSCQGKCGGCRGCPCK